ncbi:MAG: fused MFS/spermidine synthase [Chloroflexota bacterium]
MTPRHVLVPGLVGLFFASGACGLIYQVLWVRLLSLSFGITVHAVTVVLASFMAGLAIGSLAGGRVAERLRRPLVAYAVVELAVGAVAVATPWAFHLLQDVTPALFGALGESEPLIFVARVAISFGVLAVPTALMGATLPIIVKSSLGRSGQVLDRVGLLYAANTFGAISGAALAGFWLIGGVGITPSIWGAAVANALIGLGALLLHAWVAGDEARALTPAGVADDRRTEGPLAAYPPAVRASALAAYGLGGVVSFALEVVWTRMLALALDTSIYAFVTMLTMVLVGIAVGSAVIAMFAARRWHWPLVFAGLQTGVALGGIWAVWALSSLPELRAWLEATPGLNRLVSSPLRLNFVVAATTILPSTLAIGATFPVAARIYAAGQEHASERLGQIYAANVFGAIFGSALGGFVLLPALGTQSALLWLSVGSLVLAAALVLSAVDLTPRLRVGTAGTLAAVFFVLWAVHPDLYAAMFRARFPDATVEWYREGLESTVTVVKAPDGIRTLYTNSRGQANDEPVLVGYHRRIAHTPLLVRPNTADVLIVGLGAGHTAGSILQHPGTRVEVVELSDAVLSGARLFSNVNYGVVDNPGFSLRLGDGRNFLLTTNKKYDLISNDTIQPFDAGSNHLYSADYYRLVQRALKPGGVMAQWIGPLDEVQYKTMLRTYARVFPYMTLWLTADLAIGSNEPIQLDLAATARRFSDPRAREALATAGFNRPEDVAAAFVATREEVLAYVGDGPILTDDRPLVEYYRSLPSRGVVTPPDLSQWSRDASRVLAR